MSSISDAILEDILKQATLTNANLVKLLREQGAASGSTNTVAATNKSMAVSGGLVAAAFTAIGAVTSVLSTAFSYLSNAVMETGKRIYAFAKEAALGTAAMSAFYRAFDKLPIIGKVFSMFGDYLDYTESLLKSYQDISKSGASFSGELQVMRQAATASWMNLEEFGRVIKENGSIFATSTGGASAGLSKFVATQSNMMATYSNSILGLGITAEEAGNMLGLYMKMQGSMTKLQGQSTDQIAASTFGLITQLDAYAKITGQSREQAEEELKKQTLDATLTRFMQSLNPDQMAAAQFSLQEAMRLGGQGMRDQVAQMLISQGQITAPILQSQKDIFIQTQGASVEIGKMLYNNAMNNKLGTDAFTAGSLQARNAIVAAGKSFDDTMGLTNAAMIGHTGAIKYSNELSRTMNEGFKDVNATIAEVNAAQKSQASGTAAATAQLQVRLKQSGMDFGAAILGVMARFEPQLTAIGDRLLALFTSTFNQIMGSRIIEKFITLFEKYLLPAIEGVITWLADTFTYLTDSDSMAQLWERVGKKAVEGVQNLWAVVKPAFIAIWAEVKPLLVEGFKTLFAAMITAIPSTIASAAFNGVMGLGALAAKPGNWIGEKLYPSTKSAPPPQTTPIAREFGGKVQSGKEYLVGERGREKFVAPADGKIISESGSDDRENNLLREIRMLNRHVEQLIIHNRDTAIYTRRNADAISSLSGDLFKF